MRFRTLLTEEAQPPIFWEKKLNVDISNTHWESIFQSTKEIGLRAIQWNNLHVIYHANILLNKMGIDNSDKCSACHSDDKAYITNFFFTYAKVHQHGNL